MRKYFNPQIYIFILMVAAYLPPAGASTETRYVTDQVTVAIREEKKPDAAVKGIIRTGADVSVIETSGEYLRIRTPAGEEGWVLARYMVPERPGSAASVGIAQERDRLKESLAACEQSQATAGTTVATDEALRKKSEELAGMTEKYNRLLAEKGSGDTAGISAEVARLKQDTERLKESKRERLELFAAGGGIFFIGWLVGRMSRKKRRYY